MSNHALHILDWVFIGLTTTFLLTLAVAIIYTVWPDDT